MATRSSPEKLLQDLWTPRLLSYIGLIHYRPRKLLLLLLNFMRLTISLFLQPAKVPLNGTTDLQHINHSSQFGVFHKLAKRTPRPIHLPGKTTSCCWLTAGLCTTNCISKPNRSVKVHLEFPTHHSVTLSSLYLPSLVITGCL